MSRVRAAPAAALLATFALVGCGESAEDVVTETARNISDIRSGRLDMRMVVQARTPEAERGEVGFELSGPFALPRGGGLPRADVEYTQIAGDRRGTVTLVSTGEAAFVEVGGQAYELPPDQAERLRIGTARLGEGEGGGRLRVASWVRDPELADGGTVDGVETDRVSGPLNLATAATDLLRLSQALGQDAAPLRALEQGADQLEQAVQSSGFDLWTGKEDRLLRRLRISVQLAVEGSRADVRFALDVAKPNRPVEVERPQDPLPPSALPQG
ncbi:MAG TPA: hypothetical protein VHG69_09325 [Thermoleophilaceae bacterium]|nr:hypothetical protein [Thermoleophilaceae bacterium]